jgi:N-acetylglucosamine kinase-like BadF-type ATPase
LSQRYGVSAKWFVAIDGGGSKTAGAIATQVQVSAGGGHGAAIVRLKYAGTGSAAPATWNAARQNLIRMFESLLAETSLAPQDISHAVLMLAGAGRPEDVSRVTESFADSPLSSCKKLTVTSDIQPLLHEALVSDPESPSIVVISGTGSLVAALDSEANPVRAGGWGPILGDEGSGWGISLAFLKTFCSWIDDPSQSAPEGLQLLRDFLSEKRLPSEPHRLSSAIIALANDRHLAAQLAPRILELATEPSMSSTNQLVLQQIAWLARHVQQIHRQLSIASQNWRLCLAGGLAANNSHFQKILTAEISRQAINPASVTVLDPLTAALRLAADDN